MHDQAVARRLANQDGVVVVEADHRGREVFAYRVGDQSRPGFGPLCDRRIGRAQIDPDERQAPSPRSPAERQVAFFGRCSIPAFAAQSSMGTQASPALPTIGDFPTSKKRGKARANWRSSPVRPSIMLDTWKSARSREMRTSTTLADF